MGEFLTIRQVRERFGISLSVDDFISKPEPCSRDYVPFFEVSEYLMGHDKAEEAENLFRECQQAVGDAFGSFASKKNTPEFQIPAQKFKVLTGVEVWDIMMESRKRLATH